jgi:biofilm PGA synthesis lipoprotein PgaB
LVDPQLLSADQQSEWTNAKVEKINELSLDLLATVAKYRPEIESARTLYAPVVLDQKASERFAQNYRKSLEIYDSVVIMAYPYLEEVKNPKKWLKELVSVVKEEPKGIEKTVFKVQTYDWKKARWISDRVVDQWLEVLVSAGARHLAYYPDDYVQDHPKKDVIRATMSIEDFPFTRDWK